MGDGGLASQKMQVGRVMSGSSSVMIGGKPAANTQSKGLMCVANSTAAGPGAPSVQIG
jgi:uncharacterized Zn-binding protein involved in type VI secretion